MKLSVEKASSEKTVGKTVKKAVATLAMGVLGATGIIAVQTVQPAEKAEAAPCYIDIRPWEAYNRGCAPIRHLAYVRGMGAIPGTKASAWNWSYQWTCYEGLYWNSYQWA